MKYILTAVFSLVISLSTLAGSPRPKASAKRSPTGTLIVYRHPGQTVYIQYTIYPWMGTVFEVSEDQVEARQTASGLKQQE
jgi:hypothetical protein